MKSKLQFLRWLMLLMLSLSALGTWAQQSTSITQTVCPGTEPYLVTPSNGSDSFTWSISTGTAGIDWTITSPNASSTNVIWTNTTSSPITYTLSLKEDNGLCYTTVSVDVTVNPQPAIPLVGTITQPTCALATGSVILSGLPVGNWTINPGSIAGTGSSYTVSGLNSGVYNFTVTNTSNCVSLATANVTINAQPTAPVAATASTTIQPTCALATGTIVVTAPLGATLEYSIDGGAYQASTTFAGVAAGSHAILVRSTTDITCISDPTSVTVNAQPTTPTTSPIYHN